MEERDATVANDDARTDAPAENLSSRQGRGPEAAKAMRQAMEKMMANADGESAPPSGAVSNESTEQGGWRLALAEAPAESEEADDAGADGEAALPAEIAEDGGDVAIPETADGYTLPKIEGHEWTKDDEPALESFLAELHEAQAPQPVIDKALGWYAKHQAQLEKALEQRDAQDTTGPERSCRKCFASRTSSRRSLW